MAMRMDMSTGTPMELQMDTRMAPSSCMALGTQTADRVRTEHQLLPKAQRLMQLISE